MDPNFIKLIALLALAGFLKVIVGDSLKKQPAKKTSPAKPSRKAVEPLVQAKQKEAQAQAKGEEGEQMVRLELTEKLPADLYHQWHDLLVPNGYNGWSQIDHVVLCAWGIFVVETKQWGGWIYGRAGEPNWTQSFTKEKRNPVANPLRQNWGHIQALNYWLDLPEMAFHNLVMQTGKAEFKNGLIPGVFTTGLAEHIRSFIHPVFTPETLEQLVMRMTAAKANDTPAARVQHLTQVNQSQAA